MEFFGKIKVQQLCLICVSNIQHYFFAEMIKRGHFVVTTNFDHLIEQALINLGIPQNKIEIFIEENDYVDQNMLSKSTYKLFKLHGTVKNVIEGKFNLKSIMASLNQIGKGRRLFQIDEGKKEILESLLSNYDCIILGYSGRDDFDVVPILENFVTNSKKLIWIKHSRDKDIRTAKIIKINPDYKGDIKLSERAKCDQILYTIVKNRKRPNNSVYKIEASTSGLIKNFLIPKFINRDINHLIETSRSCDVDLKKEIQSNERYNVSEEIKYFFTGQIYHTLSLRDKALNIWEEGRKFCEKRKNEYWLSQHYKNLAIIYYSVQSFDIALDYNIRALRIYEKHKALPINLLENIGRIYHDLGDIPKSFEHYESALELAKKNNLKKQEAHQLAIIAHIFNEQGESSKALRYYNKAEKIFTDLGLKSDQAMVICNKALIDRSLGNYEEAISKFHIGLKLFALLGDKRGKATVYGNIGIIQSERGQKKEALLNFVKSLKIYKILKDNNRQANQYAMIANIMYDYGKSKNALKLYNRALEIHRRFNYKFGEARDLINIAIIHREKGEFNKEERLYLEDLKIYEELGQKIEIAETHINLGNILADKKDLLLTHDHYKISLNISLEIKNKKTLSESHFSIGNIYYHQRRMRKALEQYNKAENLFEEIGFKKGLGLVYMNKGILYNTINLILESNRLFRKALAIFVEIDEKRMVELIKNKFL